MVSAPSCLRAIVVVLMQFWLVCACVWGLPTPAVACRCDTRLTLAKRYTQADLVIVGTVIDVVASDPPTRVEKAVVTIERSWKKQVTASVTVYTDGTCAYPLAKGGRYLLFLQMADGDAFGTSKCAGNKRATEAEAVVRWLDKRSAATTSKKKS